MKIRDATPDDLEDILDMIRGLAEFERMTDEVAFDPADMREHLFGDDPVASVAIADVDGEIAGMALWFRTFSTFLGRPGIWLEDLYVRPAFRGRGVASALLHHLRGLTAGRVEWSVLDWNQPAIDLYERIGAQPDEDGWVMYRWAAAVTAEPDGQETAAPAGEEPAAAAGEQPAATAGEEPAETGIRALVGRGREQVTAGQARFEELLERHRHRPLLDVGLRIHERDRESAGTVVGSAIAFRLFLFFVPLLLFVVGVAGFLASFVDEQDLDEIGVTGGLASQINTALTQPNSTRWIAVFFGLVGMATTGRSLSRVLVAASCLAWRLPVKPRTSVRLVGAVVGLVFCIALVSAVLNRIRTGLGLGVVGVSFVAVLAIYAAAWLLLSMLLPRATTDPGALLPGAVLVALTMGGMQAISQLYLPNQLSRASDLYGAIGTTIVTLGWFFILGRAMMLSMSINAVVYERFGSISQFVFGLPLVRALPRRSAWIRRFFQLDS